MGSLVLFPRMEDDPNVVISVVASVLVCVGYAPEFARLYKERSSSPTGLPMWLIWTSSSLLSSIYSVLSGAPPFVISNICLIFTLTLLSTLGNLFFVLQACREERRGQGASQVPQK